MDMGFMTPARLILILALVAAGLLGVSGTGVRLGLWPFRAGFQLLRWSAYLGLAAAAAAAIGLLIPKARAGGLGSLAVALVLGLGVAYLPWHWQQRARALPPIHDISTDLEHPPAFVAVLPLRSNAANPSEYGGPEVATAQRQGYPDIHPLILPAPPPVAFARALAAAEGMGWTLVAADSAAGRIEATATTAWFGFKDDVVIRVTPATAGSRIDVRSVSRVGKSDVGTNAARIRSYLAKVSGM
jgi:uncharacterized protein (DUF1499 family)